MAIETMKKVRLATHKSVSEDIFAGIQKLGCCQIIPGSHERVGEGDVAALRSQARRVDELLGEARFVMRFMEPYATEKGGGLAKALGDAPSCSRAELESRASESAMKSVAEGVRSLEKRLSEVKAAISRVGGLISSLEPIKDIPYSLDFYTKGTETVQGSVLQVTAQTADEFVSRVKSSLGDEAEVFAAPASGGASGAVVSVIYSRAADEKFQEVVSAFQTSRVEAPSQLSGTAAVELKSLNAEMSALKSSEAEVIVEIRAASGEACEVSELCSDYWGIQRSKIEALIDGEQTAQAIVSDFWIPASRVDDMKRALEPYSKLSDVEISDPGDGDRPPTLLRNPKWSRPIEALVTMYGIPAYGGFDPTVITTPFFYAFFGICFGDAAYGLLIAGAIAALLAKTRPSDSTRGFLTIILVGNLCAFAFGAITCSWFGDSLTSFSFLKPLGWLSSIQLLDPMRDPMKMLVISLVIGFVQIMLGLVMAMRANLIKGDKVAAFADQGGWILFLCGLVLIGLSAGGVIGIPTKVSGMAALAGAVVLVATQGREKKSFIGKLFSGVMSLYNVTGYLGDVLSYSRLLALGLGSAAIAMVVNLLANLVSGVPFVGVLLGILVFVMGHVFGMAINILGAFIHSLRLQYVEFFGKFYDASGEEFKPLTNATCYIRLTE